MNRASIIFLLLIFIILGTVLRIYRLTEVPAGLLQDEASAGYDAYSLFVTGRDHHGASWPVTFQTFNDWTGHSFNYQLIPFVKLFGLSVFSIRFAVAFLSILSIPLIYLVGKELTGKKELSLLMAFLFSLSQYSVINSRWAVQPNTVVFFFSLGFYLFLAGLNRINKRYFYWFSAGLFFGLAVYTYPSVEGFIPIWLIGALGILFWVRKKSDQKMLIRDTAIFIAVLSLVVIPLVFDHFKRPQTITTKLSMVSVLSQSENPILSYLQNYLSYFLPNYLFFGGEVNPTRTVPGFGYENPFLGVFYYLGILVLFFKNDYLRKKYHRFDKTKIYLICWFLLIFPSIPALTVPPGDFQRAIYIMPVAIFLIALGLIAGFDLVKYLGRRSAYNWPLIFVVISAVIYLYFQCSFYTNYFGPKYQAVAQWYFQYGMEEVVKFISNEEGNYKNIIFDNTINQPYIYLLFYQKVDPRTLDYGDFSEIDPATKWLSVKKYRNYLFRKVTVDDVKEGKLIKKVFNSPYSSYAIYEKEKNLFVKFETKDN